MKLRVFLCQSSSATVEALGEGLLRPGGQLGLRPGIGSGVLGLEGSRFRIFGFRIRMYNLYGYCM